ncbi:MAG: hypothetical protein VX466_02565 [Myxococcota bacterium]|nr:hypothetical protein [Myxococcota bacterium]
MQRFASARYRVALGIVLIAVLHSVAFASGAEAAGGGAVSDRAADAAERADLVVLGRVAAKRSYLPVDGGFGYDIVVSETLKGTESGTCSFRAGGWAYQVDLGIGAEVLLFLEESDAFLPAERFKPAYGPERGLLVFLVRAGRLAAATGEGEPGWEGRSVSEVREAVAAAK